MEYLGLLAACLTTISFLPQVIQIIKTKDTKSISLKMYILFVTGTILWFVYGLFIKNLPVTLANFITGTLAVTILYYKLRENKSIWKIIER